MSKLRVLNQADPIKQGMKFLSDLDLNKTADIIPFPTPLPGGKGTGDSGFWLMDLDVGTVFLARSKSDKQAWHCAEFALFEKYTRCACLFSVSHEGTRPMHVDMRRFSNQWEMVEVIKIIPQEKLGKPTNHEQVINVEGE